MHRVGELSRKNLRAQGWRPPAVMSWIGDRGRSCMCNGLAHRCRSLWTQHRPCSRVGHRRGSDCDQQKHDSRSSLRHHPSPTCSSRFLETPQVQSLCCKNGHRKRIAWHTTSLAHYYRTRRRLTRPRCPPLRADNSSFGQL